MAIKKKVLIVDDHALFRNGLASILKEQPDFDVVGEASKVEEAISLVKKKLPDIVLMDVGLPDGNGVEAMDRILETRRDCNIVFLTVHESEELAFAALRRGAKGYLIKDIDIDKLIISLRAINRGELAISRDLSSRFIQETSRWVGKQSGIWGSDTTLTSRELQVLKEVGAGHSNQKIGERLNISPNTVKVHISNIRRKLELKSRSEIVEFVQRHGLIGKP